MKRNVDEVATLLDGIMGAMLVNEDFFIKLKLITINNNSW